MYGNILFCFIGISHIGCGSSSGSANEAASTAKNPILIGGSTDTTLNLSAVVTTLAGSGSTGSNDATGASATFSGPQGITIADGFAYIADTNNNKIRRMQLTNGAVTTFAGSGSAGSTDGIGISATFNTPIGITTDGTNLFVADYSGRRIRKITISTANVTTLAGSGANGSADGIGISATFGNPVGITTDGTNLFVADAGNHKIRKIQISNADVTTLAGTGTSGSTDATGTLASFSTPTGLTYQGGNLYITEGGNNKIRKLVLANNVVSTFAGSGVSGSANGTGTSATFASPSGITNDGNSLYVSEYTGCRIRKISLSDASVTTLAGSGTQASVDGTGILASFNLPYQIAADASSLWVVDSFGHKVRRIQ